MRGTVARMLRRAAGTRGTATTYEQPQIHHLVEFPVFETYRRTVREMGPVVKGERRRVVTREVEKIRYLPDGKTPAKPMVTWVIGEDGELEIKPQTMLVPVAKPYRLKAGSPRRVLRVLKRLHRAGKLDEVFRQIQAEATV